MKIIILNVLRGFGSFFAYMLPFSSQIHYKECKLQKPLSQDWQNVGGDLSSVFNRQNRS